MNQVIVVGNIGAKPDLKYLPTGRECCNFSIAWNKKWTDKGNGQAQEKTIWFRVNVFGKLAEICAKHLDKGSKILVTGEASIRTYKDKQGQDKESFEINAKDIEFLTPKKSDSINNSNLNDDSRFTADHIPF